VIDPKFTDEELSAARTQITHELDDLNKRPEVMPRRGRNLSFNELCPAAVST
jgi:hypothetical protein